jgi:signal transduction histidine kinase
VRTLDAEARLHAVLEAHALLHRVAADLGPGLDLQTVLTTALTAMHKVVDFQGGSIQLLDEDGLYVAAADPDVSAEVRAARLPVGEGLGGRIVATGEAIVSDDLDRDPRVDPNLRALGSNVRLKSYLGVPMVSLGEVVGVMQVDSPDPDAFDHDDLTLLAGLAVQVAAAIESARRFELVMELERLKTDFISRVSHELRTPITIIDGFIATMLSRHDELALEQRRSMLERSRVAVARLSGLIEDLITLARLETGVIVSEPRPVDLTGVLQSVRTASAAPDRVIVRVDPTGRTVRTDPALLTRALGFIVDNALKYGDDGAVELCASGGEITVRDKGPGIPDDVRTTLFELFTRSKGTMSVPGLGLGLPMARTLLGILDAHLQVEPGEGGGTVVRVALTS